MFASLSLFRFSSPSPHAAWGEGRGGEPRILGLLLLLCLLPLAGCTNNPYPPGETARPVLYQTIADDPKTLDPSISFTVVEAAIMDQIYSSYYQYHYLKRSPFALELDLGDEEAKREPYVFTATDKDGRMVRKTGEMWTFRIKPGLRFQDDPCFPGGKGREIVAADFLYAWRRMADPDIACPVLPWFQDKVIGLADYIEANKKRVEKKQKADYSLPIAGLQLAEDDPKYTFRILLSEPYPQLRYLMAMHFTTPIAREAAEKYGEELARHPVGSGPYVMTEHRRKQRIVLKANPNRRQEFYPSEGMPGDKEKGLLDDAGKPLPLSDTVVFNIIRERVTSWNLFLQGYLDQSYVDQTNFQQAVAPGGTLSPEMKRLGITMTRETALSTSYATFNMKDPVYGGYSERARKLRQAVSLAINAPELIELFLQGNARKAEWLVPPGMFGNEPEYENPYRKHDLSRAKQLLAEAGYPGGIESKTGERLTLTNDNTATDAAGRMFVGHLKKQIEALGIRFESRSWRSNVWRDRLKNGEFQFVSYGWVADYPDPENFTALLYGKNAEVNYAGYQNPEYDRLFEQMRAMDDTPERIEIIRRMREITVRDCPWIPLWHTTTMALRHDWVHNVQSHPIANNNAKYVRIDGTRRAAFQKAHNRPNFLPTVLLAVVFVAGAIPAGATVRRRINRRVRREG